MQTLYFHSMSPGESALVRRLFRGSGLVVLLSGLTLVGLYQWGGNPEGWPLDPMNGYSLVCGYLLAVLLAAAAVLVFCVRRYYVDAGVRAGSVEPAFDMLFFWLTAGLLLAGLGLFGRLTYQAVWVVPTRGWPTGLVWWRDAGEPDGSVRENVEAVGFSGDGRIVFARSQRGEVYAWGNRGTITPPPSPPSPLCSERQQVPPEKQREVLAGLAGLSDSERSRVKCVARTDAGGRVVLLADDGTVSVYDGTGRPLARFASPHAFTSHAACVAVSPDGRYAVSGCERQVFLYRLPP